MKRESGFYWVSFDGVEWIIAEYDGVCWLTTGIEDYHEESDFFKIDENKIERNEN